MTTNCEKAYCRWCGEELEWVYELVCADIAFWRIRHHNWQDCVNYLKAEIDLLNAAHAELRGR